MKFKTVLLCSVFSLGLISNVKSAELTVVGNETLIENKEYNGNTGGGIYAMGVDAIIDSNYNIEASENTVAGVFVEDGADLTIRGNGSNLLKTNENTTAGLHSYYTNSVLSVEQMNIIANSNLYGIYSYSEAKLNITGATSGINTIQANNNRNTAGDDGVGVFSRGSNTSIDIKNMSVEASGNKWGVFSFSGGVMDITGVTSGINTLKANNNKDDSGTDGLGIVARSANATINIKNMDVEANGNGLDGIYVATSGKVNITGVADGSNTLQANNNKNAAGEGRGLFAKDANSKIDIKNMNVEANGNGAYGIYATNASVVNITGVANGSNTLQANNNMNASGANSGGIYSEGANTITTIENMNIITNNNALSGINSTTGSVLNIKGIAAGTNFIQSNNNKNTSGTSGFGMYLYGANSEINIENMNIETSGNDSHGIYINAAKAETIKGSSSGNNWIVANNNGTGTTGRGIYFADSTSLGTLLIQDMNIEASGNKEFGIVSGAAKITIQGNTANRNSIILKNNSSAGVHAGKSGANTTLITFNDVNIVSENNTFAQVGSKASINMLNADINVLGSNDLGFHIYNDLGAITLDNVVFNTASGKLLNFEEVSVSDTDIQGTFNATNSDLSGAIVTTTPNILTDITSNVNLTNTVWRNVGKSNITNYTANGVDAYMNVFFGSVGGGDLLTIEGTSTGATTLHVTSAGTDGSQSEVMVVDQTTATSANGTFSLAGGVVDSGAYEYELFKGDEAGNAGNSNNYYLRSNGTLTNTAKTIANIPVINIHIAKTGMNELRKRMGELRDNDPNHKSGVWARSYTKNLKVNESVDSKMNIYGFEAGYDHQIYGDCDNKVYAGLMAGYSYTDNIKTRNTRALDGSGHANTPTIGAYATWMNSNGWFADATIRSFWTEMNMTAHTSQGNPISFDIDRQFTAGSLEAGRTFAWDANEAYSQWILEPKAELSYIYGKAKSFKAKGASVSQIRYGETDSVQARGALLAGYKTTLSNGTILEPFVEAAIIQELGGKTDIHYAGADYKSDISGTSYEFNLGLNSKVNNDWNVYGEVGYETGSVVQAISTNIGVRYNF